MGNNLNKPLKVGATIGIIGGGQLGRMLVMSGKKMGFQMIVLDPTLNSPAGQVADRQIVKKRFFNRLAVRLPLLRK